jgi:type II secretory pathway component PulM
MNQLIDRIRGTWDGLNDRERRLIGAMLAVVVAFVLGFPLFWTARTNVEIEQENEQLRAVLDEIAQRGPQLEQLAEARRTAAQRYGRRTPPLGTFLEDEAKRHGLTLREVTDQPEKSVGNYHRRSVSASIQDANLTGIINLLSSVASSQYPVAVESIQIEHYQPGDNYRFKIGIVTFDRQSAKAGGGAAGDKKATAGAGKG